MPECRNCGAHVTAQFRRVFGANDGSVYGCRACLDTTDILNGQPAQQGTATTDDPDAALDGE